MTPPDGDSNIPPVAYYVASSTSGTTPFEVTFDASGSYDEDGDVESYKWDFGDGTEETTTNATITHVYESEGNFPVKLTVIDNESASGSYSDANIRVSAPNVSPTASFNSSVTSGKRPLTVEFDAGGSSDPDGDIALYEWSFGDGTPSVYGETVSHTFTEAGDFQVTLTVHDNEAEKATESQTIQVEPNEDPVADYSYEVGDNYEVTFNAGNSSDPDGTIATYEWDFNDGTTETGEIISHTFEPGRKYRVTLVVTDNDGAIDALSLDIDPEHPNQEPVAAFNYEVSEDYEVSFDAGESSDPDGTIESYSWDFGDGNQASGQTVVHVFEAGSTYDVTLTVVDNEGSEHSISREVDPNFTGFFEGQEFELSVWPNPANDYFVIFAPANSRFQVHSLDGSMVTKGKTRGEKTYVGASHLEAGTYLVRIIRGDEIKTTKVIVK
ncbi:MAG: PKD domain-containing protein [Marinilabiliaceae bacterium]